MADTDTILLPDGSYADLPAWARDATLQILIDETRKQNAMLSKDSETDKKMLTALEKLQRKETASNREVLDSLKGLNTSIKNTNEQQRQTGKAMGALKMTASAVGMVFAGLKLATLGVAERLFTAGDALNQLSLTGVGVNQSFAGVNNNLVETVSTLSTVTGSFQDSIKVINSFPSEFLVQGGNNFVDTMLYASNSAEMLGLSMSQSMEQFGGALETRRQLLDIGAVDQERMNRNIRRNVTLQRELSAVLGVSIDELASFTEQLLGNNDMLQVNFLRFNNTVRENLITSITDFAATLRATGGEAGGDIASIFLDAATKGAIGLSDGAIELVSTLPSLAEPMNRFIEQFRRGELDAQGLSDAVTGLLANLSESDRDRLFALRMISPAANQLAMAAIQMDQARERAEARGIDLNAVQRGARNFSEILTRISGFFSDVFYSTFANQDVINAVEELFEAFVELTGVDENGKALADNIKKLVDQRVVPGLVAVLKFLTNSVKDLPETLSKVKSELVEFKNEFMGDDGKINWDAFWSGLSSRLDEHIIAPMGRWFSERFTTFIREAFTATMGMDENGADWLGEMLSDLGTNVSSGAQAVMDSEVVKQLANSDLAKNIAITTGAFAAMKIAQSAPNALLFGAIAGMFFAAKSAFTAVPDLDEKIRNIAVTLGGGAAGGGLLSVLAKRALGIKGGIAAVILGGVTLTSLYLMTDAITDLADSIGSAADALSNLIKVGDESTTLQRILDSFSKAESDSESLVSGASGLWEKITTLPRGLATGVGTYVAGSGIGSALEDLAEGLNVITDNLAGIELLERLFDTLMMSSQIRDPINVLAVAVESLSDSMQAFKRLRMDNVVERISAFVVDLNSALHGLDLSNVILTARALGELERSTSRLVNMQPVNPTAIETVQQIAQQTAPEPAETPAPVPAAAEQQRAPLPERERTDGDLANKMDTMIRLLRNIENKIES